MENKPERQLEKPSIAEDAFAERSLDSMKENFMFSMLSFLWNKALADTAMPPEKMKREFIVFWKNNMRKVVQTQLEAINKALNNGNVDMINIISDENNLADVEDYQKIMSSNMAEVEELFWKISGKPDYSIGSDDDDDDDKMKH